MYLATNGTRLMVLLWRSMRLIRANEWNHFGYNPDTDPARPASKYKQTNKQTHTGEGPLKDERTRMLVPRYGWIYCERDMQSIGEWKLDLEEGFAFLSYNFWFMIYFGLSEAANNKPRQATTRRNLTFAGCSQLSRRASQPGKSSAVVVVLLLMLLMLALVVPWKRRIFAR